MTATQYVEYANRGFWAYDVALGVFLKHLIDAAETSGQAQMAWLLTAISTGAKWLAFRIMGLSSMPATQRSSRRGGSRVEGSRDWNDVLPVLS
jgi:hypothetical protein